MANEYELLKNLDSDQRAAVTAPLDKPACVRANAGSGKTTVLSSRVAYLVLKGVPGIMLLTFTNKAAKEMTERVKKLVGADTSIKIISGTFHHMACLFLRKYSNAINLSRGFSIISQSDAEAIMERNRKSILSFIPKNEIPKEFPTAKKIISMYSYYRNKKKDISLDAYLAGREILPKERELLKKIIDGYETFKTESISLDFDDLIIDFRKMLVKSEKLREVIHSKYPFILCDEYQDVNYIQKDIIDLLDLSNNQMVVGDEGQSIYGWRGSNINYILNFKQNHKNATVYTIRYNYRSGSGIVKLAENAINVNVKNETDRKIMVPFQKQKVQPVIKGFVDELHQCESISDIILNNRYTFSETAVLIRANYLMRDFEMEFRKRHIKYRVVGGTPFYEKAHIKDILSFLNFEFNHKNRIAFIRIMTMAKGVGAKTAEKLYETFRNNYFDYSKAEQFKAPTKSKEDVLNIFNIMKVSSTLSTPSEKMEYIYDNFYEEYLIDSYSSENDVISRQMDIKKFIESSGDYDKVDKFIEDLVLENNKDDDNSNAVTISTIHRAKGLEWNNVFLPYLNDNIFPSSRSTSNEALSEELRLFYVAITRAKKNLFLSYVNAFSDDPRENIQYSSRFIRELDGSLFVAM